MRTFLTIVVTAVVTLVTVLAVYLWFRGMGKIGAKEPDTVTVQQPQVGDLTEVVSVRAEARPETRVAISARVPARITKLPYKEGDPVTKGNPMGQPPVPPSVLVQLDAADLQAELLSAEASSAAHAAQIEVEKARIAGERASITGMEADLKQAKVEMERQKSLLATGDVSQSNVDTASNRFDELSAQLEAAKQNLHASELNLTVLDYEHRAAEAEIDRARESLTYTTITSTIDGVVTHIYAEEGEMVVPGTMNNPGTVIIEVADLSRMLLVAEVDETDVGRVAAGQKATARIHSFANRTFKGTVQSVALKHTVGTGSVKYYETKILLDTDGQKVFSGSSADVDIEVQSLPAVMKVPSQAVLERTEEELPVGIRKDSPLVNKDKTYATVVYRLINGKAVVTPVSIGASDQTHTQITGGLSAQDPVIVGPYKVLEGIKDGAEVKDEAKKPAPATGSKGPGAPAKAGS